MKETKLENFINANKRLQEGVKNYSNNKADDFARDALIQRFEFTFELAWKTLAEYLIANGVLITQKMPRTIIKLAYQSGILKDEKVWLDILQSRNLMSHVYNEETANQIAKSIHTSFAIELNHLSNHLSKL